MFKNLLPVLFALVASTLQTDPSTNQLPIYKDNTQIQANLSRSRCILLINGQCNGVRISGSFKWGSLDFVPPGVIPTIVLLGVKGPIGTLTTSAGAPINSKYTGSTLNSSLYTNAYFMDSMAHFVRENIPERIVHSKGTGAFGYFETTHDITNICGADFLSEVGKKTPLVTRFSVGVNDKGAPDTTQTIMGFAVKLYTEQGNFDLLGLSTPVFAIKDPSLFISFIRILKRNPVTNMQDANMIWDYVAQHPESLYVFMMVFGHRGTPYTYRHMPGFPVQTFQVYNATGSSSYVRFQFNPCAGIKYLNATETASTAASYLDYYTSDLYNSIANGDYPKWNVSVQVMSQEDVDNASYDVFDTSRTISEDDFPPQQIGQIVLNRNPTNHFADIEQLAVNPANIVPGIAGCPGTVYQARVMFYSQAHAHRLGSNYNNIPVNCPLNQRYTYNRNGDPLFNGTDLNGPNYYPNSYNGPEPYVDENRPALLQVTQSEPDNYEQAKAYYLNEMSCEEQERFLSTVTASLCVTTNSTQDRVVAAISKVYDELGNLVAQALEDSQCRH